MGESPKRADGLERSWLPRGGEAGELVRGLDWSSTPLGPIGDWPPCLKAAVALALGSGLPMSLLWGDELVQIYNDAYRPLLGARHPAAMGQPLKARPAADRQLHEQIHRQVAADRESVMLSLRLAGACGDGPAASLYVCVCYSPVLDDDGEVGGVLATLVDETPWVSAKRRQALSDARYRVLFESIDEGFCVVEMAYDDRGLPVDYRFLEVNPAFEQQTGLVGVVGRTMRELVPNHDAHWFRAYGEVARTGEATRFRARADAMQRWFDVYAFRYGSPEDRQVAVLFRNITAQIRVEEALSAGHERFRALTEALERLSCSETIDRLRDELLAASRQLVGADGVTVYLESGKYFCVGSGSADGAVWETQHHPLIAAVTDWAIGQRRTAVIADVRDDPRIPASVLRNVVKRSLVVVPVGGALPTGVVGAYWLTPHRPDEDEVAVLEVLARVAGTALGRQLAADRLRQSEERFRVLIEETAQAVWEAEPDGRLLVQSPSWEAYTGQSYEQMVGDGWLRAVHPDDRDRVEHEWLTAVAAGRVFDCELRLRHGGRGWRWTNVRAAPLFGMDGRIEKWVGMNIDVTARKLAEQAAREAALHDPLTGLPNRRLVFEYAEHLLAAADRKHSKGAVLFIDLNRFKPVNDRYGHDAGDRLLQEVGRRLVGSVRREDIVGRVGGDEFIVLLPYLEQTQEAMNIAQYVIETVSAPFAIHGAEVSVPPSIGISLFPQHGKTVDALIHAADLAMYEAKQDSRGSFRIYAPTLDHQDESSASLEGRLRRALANDALALHYQPIVELGSGALRGAEALLRFAGDEDAPTGPAHFIPVAESSGLIGAVGEWVAAEVCRQQVAWSAEGLPPVAIAINVSPIQLRQRRFAQRLADIVRESGADPAYLELEVTESALMDNADDAVEILRHVKALGLRVALDGFGCGTGSSSLGRVAALPLDTLKIDRSLVRQIGEGPATRAVVEAIIALGRARGLGVVAEGIECRAALDYLKSRGCDRGQGYLIAPPMSGDDFAQRYLRAANAP